MDCALSCACPIAHSSRCPPQGVPGGDDLREEKDETPSRPKQGHAALASSRAHNGGDARAPLCVWRTLKKHPRCRSPSHCLRAPAGASVVYVPAGTSTGHRGPLTHLGQPVLPRFCFIRLLFLTLVYLVTFCPGRRRVRSFCPLLFFFFCYRYCAAQLPGGLPASEQPSQ